MSEFNAQQARAKRPCPLWVDAFQRDTQHLEADEVGAYFLILMAMWTRESCDFPADQSRLARVSRVSKRLWRSRIGPAILEFFETTDGMLIQKRLRKEATYVERQVTQQSDRKKGKKSDKPLKSIKAASSTDTPTDGTAEVSFPTTQQPTLEEKDKSSSSKAREAREADDFYLRYLDAHPNAVESQAGEQAFDELVQSGIEPSDILASAKAYAIKVKSYSPELADRVQRSDNFLINGKGKWRDYLPRPEPAPMTDNDILQTWAERVISGRGFGLERQTADALLQAGMVTQQQLNDARGYNG